LQRRLLTACSLWRSCLPSVAGARSHTWSPLHKIRPESPPRTGTARSTAARTQQYVRGMPTRVRDCIGRSPTAYTSRWLSMARSGTFDNFEARPEGLASNGAIRDVDALATTVERFRNGGGALKSSTLYPTTHLRGSRKPTTRHGRLLPRGPAPGRNQSLPLLDYRKALRAAGRL